MHRQIQPISQPQKRHIILYDAGCRFCQRQQRRWNRLDWAGQFEWLPLNDPQVIRKFSELSPQQLATAIHCVSRSGKIYQGAHAFRFLALRTPLVAPLALLLWIPGAMWFAKKAYSAISRNRQRIR